MNELENQQNWFKDSYENLIEIFKNQKKYSIQKSKYQQKGQFPIVSQEKKDISGYTDDVNKVFNIEDQKYILFGDHTGIFKYLDFDFVVGADGAKIFKSKNENILRTKFLFYKSINNLIKNSGYNRHFKILKEKMISYPNINTQDIIISILDKQKGIINTYNKKLKILEKQTLYYQDEILSGRYRISLTKDSILYATQKGWYLNENLIKGKEQDFYEWIKIDFYSKIIFRKENELIDFKQNSFQNKISSHFKLYKIGEIGVIKTGNTPSKKEKNNYGSEFNWYTTPDFNNDTVFNSKLKLSKKGWDMARVVDINDILITCIGELGKIALVKKEGGFNQQINSLKVNDNFYYYYIFMLLKKHKVYIQSFSKKNVVDIINKNDFSNIPIYATPYIAEQISIVIFLKMFEAQKNNINEKINLEQKKFDFLMDGLLNGTIRVN